MANNMQRMVDSVVGVAKESVKTVTREAFNNVINAVNGASALALGLVPGRASIVEGLRGWELRPTFKAPRLPRWMEDGVSSLNFIYDEADSDNESVSGYESGREEYLSMPPSPSSTASYHSSGSRASPGIRPRHPRASPFLQFIRRIFWLFFWPLAFLFPRRHPHRRQVSGAVSPPSGLQPSQEYYPARSDALSRSSSNTSLSRHFSIASHELSKRVTDVLEYVTHLNDNRRRGIIEDLQLLMELSIDRAFETVRGILHSPFNATASLLDYLFGRSPPPPSHVQTSVVETTTLGDSRAHPKQRVIGLSEALNMDARTCEDIVTDAGYPFEAVKVTTRDGYVLTLERIPRRDSRKVVLLQHGILDSSIGWVSNGVVGSQAFAAYDQGFDVWLGNMRGYVSREHVNKKISAQEYWRYSVNEHGVFDMGAMVQCIHETKLKELRDGEEGAEGEEGRENQSRSDAEQPYLLSVVAHSLGGAAVMLYLVTQCMKQEPHRFSRVILLSPAGFHEKTPLLFDFLRAIVPIIDPFMERFIPGFFIPTRGLRLLFNKLAQDFQNLPAVRALVQVVISSFLVGGDSSDWVGALRQPHYNMYNMPGLAYRVMKHMAQMKGARRFTMYDYGSDRANLAVYGQPKPVDIGAHYFLVDVPVDVVMGRRDNLIPTCMVKQHYQLLKAAGRPASIKEFEYAHLDFTFAQQQDLLAYVMSRLNPPESKSGGMGVGRERREKVTPLTVRSSLSPNGPIRRVASASPAAILEAREGVGLTCDNGISRTCSAPVNGTQNGHTSSSEGKGLAARRDGENLSSLLIHSDLKHGGDRTVTSYDCKPREDMAATGKGNGSVCVHGNGVANEPVNGSNGMESDSCFYPVTYQNGNILTAASGKKKFKSRVTEIEEVEDNDELDGKGRKVWQREASISCANGADGILVQVREVPPHDNHIHCADSTLDHDFPVAEGLRRRL